MSGRNSGLKARMAKAHASPRKGNVAASAGGGRHAGGKSNGRMTAERRDPAAEMASLERRMQRAEALLALEAQIRRAGDLMELRALAVNETRGLFGFVQAFWVDFPDGEGRRPRVTAVSGLASVDRTAPLIQMVERAVRVLAGGAGSADVPSMQTKENAPQGGVTGDHPATGGEPMRGRLEVLLPDEPVREWPFREYLWLPVLDRAGLLRAGILMLRLEPWEEANALVGARLAEALGQAVTVLAPRRRLWPVRRRRMMLAVAALGLALLMLVRVPMMATAPAEVVARDPVIVAASMDGVIREVLVAPGSRVRAGQVIAVYDDTELKAQARLAARREAVAASRLASLRKAAFSDPQARAQLAEAEAELRLAKAERAHAEALLSRVCIVAPVSGIVLLADREEWVRRPVRTGERILRLARPGEVSVRIDLPVRDVLKLKPGDPVKVFLDADPLDARKARLVRISHEAREVAGGLLAYRLDADFEPGEDRGLRIGFRGTASLRGEKVPLFLWLFRRPVAALRQMVGL